MAMSPYVAAGRTFRERDTKIDKYTTHYHLAGEQQTKEHAFNAINRFENANNLVPPQTPASRGGFAAQTMHPNSRGYAIDVKPKNEATSVKPSVKFVRKPCTPLEMYDYGRVNVRSLSVNSINPDMKKERIDVRASDSLCNAPLGGLPPSIQEPIFMRPRRPSNPTTPFEGIVELPPLKRALSYQSLVGKQYLPKQVRSTRFHDRRAEAYQQGLANEFMEEQLEEQRSWDGRHGFGWKDRCRDHLGWLETNGLQDDSSWLDEPRSTWTEMHHLTYRILSALHEYLKDRRIRCRELFKALDTDMTGALEPEEFLEGMRKMRIAGCDRLPLVDFIEVLKAVDTNFDGSVSLLELDRVMSRIARVRAEARKLQKQAKRRRGFAEQ